MYSGIYDKYLVPLYSTCGTVIFCTGTRHLYYTDTRVKNMTGSKWGRRLNQYIIYMSRATVLLLHGRVLLYHPDSTQNTTVPVPKLSVLLTPTLLPKMEMGRQLLLGNRRGMDPRVWIKKKRTTESMAKMKVQWDSSVVSGNHKTEIEAKLKKAIS